MPLQPEDIRPEVMEFANSMEEKLRANDHKGGWHLCSKEHLATLLVGEVVELLAALGYTDGQILDSVIRQLGSLSQDASSESPAAESVDVSNLAMMIFDNFTKERF